MNQKDIDASSATSGRPGRKPGRKAKAKGARKASRKKGDTGRRYSETERKEIIKYVNSLGRGGLSSATKKFGVSYIALKRWMDGAGGSAGRKAKAELDPKKVAALKSAADQVKGLRKSMTLLFRTLRSLAK